VNWSLLGPEPDATEESARPKEKFPELSTSAKPEETINWPFAHFFLNLIFSLEGRGIILRNLLTCQPGA
jgi:hypothetical protein